MLVNMAGGLAARGLRVDFWLRDPDAPYLDALPRTVGRFLASPRVPAALALWLYLRRHRPDVVLAGKDRALATLLRVRPWSGVPYRVVARPGTNLSERLAGRAPRRRRRALARARRVYRGADLVVANSEGVAEDVAAIAGLPRAAVPVVRNPVVTPELAERAAAPLEHPWFAPGEPPVVLGAGGFRRQKDFATLVRAFAMVRARRPCRLAILGQGRLKPEVEALAASLEVAEDCLFPGFVDNPYPFMARAALFVLSSRWEGSPNVLTEALALGTPVVATDCPSGPREILADGAVAPLVPVADPGAMAAAMERVLDSPPAPEALRAATMEYTMERNAEAYHRLFLGLVAGPSG
jgi:glycosyltransferase involved in cell wall biosynthesis